MFSKIAGMLCGKPILDSELTPEVESNTYYSARWDYYPSHTHTISNHVHGVARQEQPVAYRCDYCGKRGNGDECKSCGAPL